MKKKIIIILSTAVFFASSVGAVESGYNVNTQKEDLVSSEKLDEVMDKVKGLQESWAKIKYQLNNKDEKLQHIRDLAKQAEKLTADYPQRAEPKIWEGIILSSEAGIIKGISALGKVKKAKVLFEESLKIDPLALQGSAYTSLGSLYYQVPGWPIGFGDDKEAQRNLKLALQINPDGIDPNFFYGDFLFGQKKYDDAKIYLEKALKSPDREGRKLADEGRRQEIKAVLSKIANKTNNK